MVCIVFNKGGNSLPKHFERTANIRSKCFPETKQTQNEVGRFSYNLAEFVFEYFRDSYRILATFAKFCLNLLFATWSYRYPNPKHSSSARSRSLPSTTQVCTLWLCGSIVANPIIYRLVPSTSRFETRQYTLKVLHHCRLTDDQWKVFSVEERGHNVFVTGQGGTGKSFLVKKIFRTLTRKGIRCGIVSASEISSTVYNDLGVSVVTIHAFYGLQAADLPWNLVIQRATSHSLVWKVRGCTVYNLGRGINV